MNTVDKILFTCICCLFFTSCSEELFNEIDTNPNIVTDVPLKSLLPGVLISYSHEIVGGRGADFAGYMSEQTTYVLGVNAYERLSLSNGGIWANGYLLLNDIKFLLDKAISNDAWSYAGIAGVMKAFTLTTMVDMMGDMPYTEALDPNIRSPKFDKHSELYPVIMEILNEAINNLEKDAGNVTPEDDDLIFGGNTELWIKTAYGLKARLYNRLSRLDVTSASQNALTAISKSFAGPEENFVLENLLDSRQNGNPFSVAQEIQSKTAIGNGIYNVMLSFLPGDDISEDPRAVAWFTKVGGEHIPAPNGVAQADFGEPIMDGAYYSKPEFLKFKTAPLMMLSYVELLFIKAEAEFNLGNKQEAYNTYLKAVEGAMDQASIFNNSKLDPNEIEGYLAYSTVSPGFENLSMETIILQKFIYFFQGQWIEAYNETRKYDFVPATNPYGRANRMTYPTDEITRNPNTPADINFFSIFEESTKLIWAY